MPTTEAAPTKAHVINAVLNGYAPRAQRAFTDAHHNLLRAPMLSGIQRTFQPDDDADKGLPPESTKVQIVAGDVVKEAAAALNRLFDLQFIQDATNATAKADIVTTDGVVIAHDVPVTYLMFLAKRLVDWRTFVDKLPVLDAADNWEWHAGHKAYASQPTETITTRKEVKPLVLYPATDKHPAQVQPTQVDERRGVWRTVKLSGALQPEQVNLLRRRVDALIDAVKAAKERANDVPADNRTGTGDAIFNYLLGE